MYPTLNRINPTIILKNFHSFLIRCPIRMNQTHFARLSIPSNPDRTTISIRINPNTRFNFIIINIKSFTFNSFQSMAHNSNESNINPKKLFDPYFLFEWIRASSEKIFKSLSMLFNPFQSSNLSKLQSAWIQHQSK